MMSRRAAIGAAHGNSVLPAPEDAFSVGPLVGRVRSVLLSSLDGELQPFGITATQFGILKHVAEGTARTAADLCRVLHYDTGSMSRMVDRLEEKELIRRERSKDDRRQVTLRVTPAGRAALPRLRDIAARVIASMLTGFSAGEVHDLKRYLDRMIENGQAAHHAGARV